MRRLSDVSEIDYSLGELDLTILIALQNGHIRGRRHAAANRRMAHGAGDPLSPRLVGIGLRMDAKTPATPAAPLTRRSR
jgi:hypothetical protein